MAARVSPVDPAAAASARLPRASREVRSGRHLAVCHLTPSPSASPCSRRVAFLFHGVGGSADVFRHQVPLLLRLGYEVVAPDLLGHGRSGTSPRAEDFTFAALRRDALRLFDEFAAPDGANALVGHSYGTSFVTYLCHERPRQVALAVQMAGGGPNALGNEPGSLFACCACFFVCAGPALRRLVRGRLFRPGGAAAAAAAGAAGGGGDPRRLAFSIGAREFKMVMNGQCWPQGDEFYHAEVRTPTLLLHGESDSLVSLEDQLWMRQTLGGPSRLVTVPAAGHMPMLEQPDATNAHLADFLLAGGFAEAADDGGAAAPGPPMPPTPPPHRLRSRRSGSVKSLPCGSQLLRY